MVAVGGLLAVAQLGEFITQEREDRFGEHREHLIAAEPFEAAPAQVDVGPGFRVVPDREDRVFDGLSKKVGFLLGQRLLFIEPLQEQQIRDLFDDFQGVGNTAAPERIPDLVYLGLNFTCDHPREFSGQDRQPRTKDSSGCAARPCPLSVLWFPAAAMLSGPRLPTTKR